MLWCLTGLMCGQNLHNLWNSCVWCGVSYCNIGTPHLTPAHQAVVYMQISQSALSRDIVNICCYPPPSLLSPLSSHSHQSPARFLPQTSMLLLHWQSDITSLRTSACWSVGQARWPHYLLSPPSCLSATAQSSLPGVAGRSSVKAKRWTGPLGELRLASLLLLWSTLLTTCLTGKL